jgi:hypothetical protein
MPPVEFEPTISAGERLYIVTALNPKEENICRNSLLFTVY